MGVVHPGDDQDFWIRHVRFGVRVSLALLVATGPYLLLGTSRASRPFLLGVISLTSLFTLFMNRLPWSRILTSRHPMWVFYVWSSVASAAITLAAAADGGVNSPLLLYYALPMLYAAIAYPPRAVFTLSAAMLGAVALMAIATDVTEPDRVWLTLAVLALSSWSFTHASSNYRAAAERSDQLAQQLREQANVDSLTGCMNHRSFQERLAVEVARAQRSGRPLGLLLGDLDHFKQINDEYGHAVGDIVLERVGRSIKDALRAGDEVARIGGEEFAVLLPDADRSQCVEVAERLRAQIGLDEDPVAVTISFGVGVLPTMAETPEALLEFADLGLYAAKASGRDCVAVHRAGQHFASTHHDTVEGRVSDLLAGNQLHAAYQPIVDMRTGTVIAYEALARIRDSQLRPDQWLELAEQTGQRIELEGAMLAAAFDGWIDQPADVKLFVNLSPDALAAGAAWAHLDRMGPHVVIEVSERQPIVNYDAVRSTIRDLASHGIRLAIDDVGAGHANMRHVMELFPAYIKLDRSLVQDVDTHQVKASLIGALAAFTSDIGVSIIGEGIERAAEAATLERVGVDLGQGYLIARPATPPPVPAWPATLTS